MLTDMTNIRGKFYSNLSTKYRDIASRGISVNGQRTSGQTTRQHDALRLLLLAEALKRANPILKLNSKPTYFYAVFTFK